ncbi:hypothetical protein SAMN02745126_02566 [Enhydrobacter aerosaccus]|uniref:Beta-barrel assembly machine subunit BamE n=1 Tax=Enhydrobacter aerosaccus TaxID=225324 RepID=A0A1T4P1M0_9HYPH|nr:hypothetical protein [Enhydrobacter aerosaccus]SJZ85424.1 hypothetical protein SAMN02745126_02566 [Enhydrobacter aerosaccus]
MKLLAALLSALLLLGVAVLLPGCASGCGATTDKLAALRRGMSYDETIQVMGCSGSLVTPGAPASSAYSIVEWDGPPSRVFNRTRIDFLDGKLVSYTTELRGAL